MSLLIDINPEPSFAPKISTPGRERLIAGNPVYRCWPQDASRGDKVQTGVWEATPGEHHSKSRNRAAKPGRSGAGDSSAMKPGSVGVWPTIETVREIYVCVED